MTPDAALADRNAAVRAAVREWPEAGADLVARIDALYPDDRSRAGPVFRVLFFGFALLAGAAATGLGALIVTSAWTAIVMGAILLVATEAQVVAWRRADGGAEAATALLGVFLLVLGTVLVLDESYHPGEIVLTRVGLSLAVAVCWLGAGRWGFPSLAVLGSIAVAGLLATLPGGRALWLAVGTAATAPLLRAMTARRFPPVLRLGFAGALCVALAAAYLALNVWSLDSGWIEEIGGRPPNRAPWLSGLAALATAVVPVLVLWLGVALRRRLLLWVGAVTAAASIVTLRHYVPAGPSWLWLATAGALCAGVALAVRRVLVSAPGGERWGFTAELGDGARRLEAAAATAVSIAVLTPEAKPAESEQAFTAGGGKFGGGGASDSF
jgi:hypothetical protein